VISADQLYVANDGPPKQGDILLAGVARLVAAEKFTPPAWRPLDVHDVVIESGGQGGNDLQLCAGPALVLATSHDCHFDKEWNRRRRELVKAGVEEQEAGRLAEADTSLDRTFNASPLVDPGELSTDRRQLMDGKIVGYYPVPASADGLVPEAVADLTYRVTLDRLDVVRVACISPEGQAGLRYALARLDALRAPSIGFEIEAVVGRPIERVAFPKANPLVIELHLEGGDTIELLQQPGGPGPGLARTQPPGH
jgi:hypothetical protein